MQQLHRIIRLLRAAYKKETLTSVSGMEYGQGNYSDDYEASALVAPIKEGAFNCIQAAAESKSQRRYWKYAGWPVKSSSDPFI